MTERESGMGWLKLSDDFTGHPKVIRLSNPAFRAWVESLTYAARYLTDGRLPAEAVGHVPKRLIGEIVSSGLWKPEPDGSFTIHDWSDYNPSADETRARRQAATERKRRQRRGGDGRFHE